MQAGGRWAVFETVILVCSCETELKLKQDGTSLYDVVAPPTADDRTVRMSAGLPTGVIRPIHGPLAKTMIP